MSVIVDQTKVRRDEAQAHADRARELVENALRGQGELYRLVGPDRLLAAASVYATLALRG